MNEKEFQNLQQRVEQISSELDKQNTVRVVNTKWMMIVGALIISALGFTSFVQIPREADRAAREQVGPEIIDKANKYISDLRTMSDDAKVIKKELGNISELKRIANLPIGTIISSMLDPIKFANEVGDPSNFDSVNSKWVLADGQVDIKGSRYAIQLSSMNPGHSQSDISDLSSMHTPDLRGMFLRGMNVGRNDGMQDPEGGRVAGSLQNDDIKPHSHRYKDRQYAKTEGANQTDHNRGAGGGVWYQQTEENEGLETRPKNAAVYFYIKIN